MCEGRPKVASTNASMQLGGAVPGRLRASPRSFVPFPHTTPHLKLPVATRHPVLPKCCLPSLGPVWGCVCAWQGRT